MLKPGWFNELSPQQQIVYDKVFEIIKQNYKSFWYRNISTPAVEKNHVLLAKSGQETSKQIFWLYGLAQWAEDLKDYSLRFDLTIPFARYVLDWKKNISFPFKRSQIQNVWRGERQQKCRFKEFTQADIDVIWQEWEENLYYDSEILFVVYKTIDDILWFLQEWGFEDNFFFRISHRKVIWWFLEALFPENNDLKEKTSWLIDKLEKIWEKEFINSLKDLKIWEEDINKILNFINAEINMQDLLSWKWFVQNKEFDEWIQELYTILFGFHNLGKAFWKRLNYKIDFSIIRWLDYYTWMVFETSLEENNSIWSIGWGGRYEKLTSFLNPKVSLSWVWWSIGIDRFLCLLFHYDFLEIEDKIGFCDYLFLNFPETKESTFFLMKQFIDKGYKVEFYPEEDKLKKQFKYADKKKISKVIVLWKEELQNWIYKIKDMKTWKEEDFPLK